MVAGGHGSVADLIHHADDGLALVEGREGLTVEGVTGVDQDSVGVLGLLGVKDRLDAGEADAGLAGGHAGVGVVGVQDGQADAFLLRLGLGSGLRGGLGLGSGLRLRLRDRLGLGSRLGNRLGLGGLDDLTGEDQVGVLDAVELGKLLIGDAELLGDPPQDIPLDDDVLRGAGQRRGHQGEDHQDGKEDCQTLGVLHVLFSFFLRSPTLRRTQG